MARTDERPTTYRLGPERITVRVSSGEANDRLFVVESEIAPVGATAPLHSHPVEEWLHVLAGAVILRTDDGDHALAAGCGRFVPAGAFHAVVNDGPATARVQFAFAPGRMMQGFYRDADAADGPAAVLDAARRHGMVVRDTI